MPTDKVDNKKRQLMRGTVGLGVVGSVLPSAWTKPVVNAVVLPAHAEISPMTTPPATTLPATTLPPGEPAFMIEKIQSGGANPVTMVGDVIEYEITVTNTGDVDLTEVIATDTMPDGTVVVLSGQTESITPDNILQIGETWTFATMYEATLDDVMVADDLVNSVSVEVAELPDPQVDDVETPVVPQCPELVINDVGFSLQSNANTNICGITIFIVGSDPVLPLRIISVEDDFSLANEPLGDARVLPGGVQVGDEVTANDALVLMWTGLGITACSTDAQPIFDVTFTITAQCEAGAGEEVVLEFSLSDLPNVTVA